LKPPPAVAVPPSGLMSVMSCGPSTQVSGTSNETCEALKKVEGPTTAHIVTVAPS
jgi:hypothetical protein